MRSQHFERKSKNNWTKMLHVMIKSQNYEIKVEILRLKRSNCEILKSKFKMRFDIV